MVLKPGRFSVLVAVPVKNEAEPIANFLRALSFQFEAPPYQTVTVSARTNGRAIGGMADTIRRRMMKPDEMLDERLEPAVNAAQRPELRSLARVAWLDRSHSSRSIEALGRHLEVPAGELRRLLLLPYFGSAWAAIEARSSQLKRLRVPVADLDFETNQARSILQACEVQRANVITQSALTQPHTSGDASAP